MHMYERVHPVLNGTTMQTGNIYRTNLGIPHVVQVRFLLSLVVFMVL
jgi:hypothetical protein